MGKPLSQGPPRPFWGSKPHERSEGGLAPQKRPRRPKAKWFSPQFNYPPLISRLSSNYNYNYERVKKGLNGRKKETQKNV